jgi:hypothetical protein
VQGALYARTVVIAEIADSTDHMIDLGFGDFLLTQLYLPIHKARLGPAAQVQYDLQQILTTVSSLERSSDGRRQHGNQRVQIICDL